MIKEEIKNNRKILLNIYYENYIPLLIRSKFLIQYSNKTIFVISFIKKEILRIQSMKEEEIKQNKFLLTNELKMLYKKLKYYHDKEKIYQENGIFIHEKKKKFQFIYYKLFGGNLLKYPKKNHISLSYKEHLQHVILFYIFIIL